MCETCPKNYLRLHRHGQHVCDTKAQHTFYTHAVCPLLISAMWGRKNRRETFLVHILIHIISLISSSVWQCQHSVTLTEDRNWQHQAGNKRFYLNISQKTKQNKTNFITSFFTVRVQTQQTKIKESASTKNDSCIATLCLGQKKLHLNIANSWLACTFYTCMREDIIPYYQMVLICICD